MEAALYLLVIVVEGHKPSLRSSLLPNAIENIAVRVEPPALPMGLSSDMIYPPLVPYLAVLIGLDVDNQRCLYLDFHGGILAHEIILYRITSHRLARPSR